ncbi:universal stress protein [Haloarchaeobius sp. DFWS5]|uniref:universal stress protein n=1 Tax=Haloarchaeobius sp. DFWS5 TaxID=3446114 RepID=UPI003EBA562C
MFDRVLIAVDGSECATRAASAGVKIAATYGSDVTAITAVNGGLDEADARRALDAVVELGADTGVPVESRLVAGHPVKAIVTVADEIDAALIVMGRLGHTGVRDRFFGSVTQRVLRSTRRNVLTVPEGETPVDDFQTILLPTDRSTAATAGIPPAVDLATRYDAALHVLTLVDVRREAGPFSAGGVDTEYVDGLLATARDGLTEFVDDCRARGGEDLVVEAAALKGVPSAGIVDYVTDHDIDLVVMASTGESSLAGQLLGSVTERVLRTIDRPVLVVHPTR